MDKLGLALSYGDVRLKTQHSDIVPADAVLKTRFSKNVTLNCPLISSPMDTVTEHRMAIAMAKQGGIGIIHRSLSPKEQAREVGKVKFHLNGLIKKPITVDTAMTISDVEKIIQSKHYNFQSFPVINKNDKLLGILTGTDFDFCIDQQKTVSEIMSKKIVTAQGEISIENAFKFMQENRKKTLPLIDKNGKLIGLYIFSDVKRIMTDGSAVYNLDRNGNLRVGAAVGTGEDTLERVELLTKKKVDVIVIDTAHGDSKKVLDTLKKLKKRYSKLDVVVGNVSEAESAKKLSKAGADGIKVGQGPGSICTTRVIAGIGCPQATAVYNCAKALRSSNVPLCADGGIKYSGDITIALGAGADSVMLGNLLAGTEESPGETIMTPNGPVKRYRGMGSLGAMEESQASRERYGQTKNEQQKLVPEGVEGIIPFRGKVGDTIDQLLGGLRSGMGYIGAKNIQQLKENADFYRISGSGLNESHPHDIKITKEAPNYRR
ncbi:IMP dehydrogenase [bacterium]|nr:MAG: IMP dehydrogenase [bacterium]